MFDGIRFHVVPEGTVECPPLTAEQIACLGADDIIIREATGDAWVRPALWEKLKAQIEK